VVKTLGDAVMATFHSADPALAAALEMRTAFEAWRRARATSTVHLNVGVHVGPALAVHTGAAGGLDWFGRHVNLASRAQSAARDGALVMTAAVREDPLASERLARAGLEPIPFDSDLKGIGATRLFRLDRSPRDP
jgi:class 3 adenylate cyclase